MFEDAEEGFLGYVFGVLVMMEYPPGQGIDTGFVTGRQLFKCVQISGFGLGYQLVISQLISTRH